jgi:Flp pilus assembly protein TadG
MTYAADVEGQVLVIVAGAMAVLIAALVLSVEFGYGFVERRDAQNDADAAALAVGRRLASTYVSDDQPFGATVEELCLEAARFSTNPTEVLTLTFANETQAVVQFTDALGAVAETVATESCASAAGSTLSADQGRGQAAVFVRVQAVRTYPSVFGGAVGRNTMTASGWSRSRLTSGALLRPLQLPTDPAGLTGVPGNGVSGLSTAPSVAIWPFVRYFDPAEVALWTACGAYCDRTRAGTAIRLWESGGAPRSAFKGLVSLSHVAWHGPSGVHQLITESDWSGTTPASHGHANTTRLQSHGEGGCMAPWDTQGQLPLRGLRTAAHCDVPNWFWYGYRGSLSLDTDWTPTGSWATRGYLAGAVQPMALPAGTTRYSCQRVPSYFPTPSCSRQVGDWVETVNGTVTCDGECDDEDTESVGDLSPTMLAGIRQFIAQYGRELPNSGGSKAVVVNVFMWDCAEQFRAGSWSAVSDSRCSPITDNGALRRIGRVHLVTVAPFTIYEDGVNASHLDAYWGNAFGDAGACQRNWNTVRTPTACLMNPVMNSAFLVPDE